MKREKNPIKLQKKILIANILLLVVPCLIFSSSVIFFINTKSNREINQAQMVVLNHINTALENYLYNAITYSDTVCSDLDINKMVSTVEFNNDFEKLQTRRSICKYLDKNRRVYSGSRYHLEIIGENGCSYSTEEQGGQMSVAFPGLQQLKKEKWYCKLDNKVCYVLNNESKEYSKVDPQGAFHMVRQIKNFNSGRIIGLTDISISYEVLAKLLKEDDDSKQEVFLINEKGEVVGTSDGNNKVKDGISKNDLMCVQKYDHGYFQSSNHTNSSQVYFVTNQSTGWKIVTSKASKGIGGIHNNSYIFIIVVAVMEVILAAIMSMYNAKYISRPVKKLEEDMKIVSRGNLSIRTEPSDIVEFREVSIQFNKMLARIEQLIEQLQQRDEEKRVLELQALQAQINPHFLYNTLASIRFLVEMGMEEKADTSLLALGKLLRKTFSDHRELITVQEEMQNLENYLILMENRYQDTFEWKINLAEEALTCKVPRISVQPLVENSISHAFNEKDGMGHIMVDAFLNEQNLIIKVMDDGTGGDAEVIMKRLMEPSEIMKKKQVSGIGIKNVQERLQHIFGEEYGLKAENVETGGICMIMYMPVIRKEEKEDLIRYDKDCNS